MWLIFIHFLLKLVVLEILNNMKKLSNLNILGIVLLVFGWPLIIFYPSNHLALNLIVHTCFILSTVCLVLDLFTKKC